MKTIYRDKEIFSVIDDYNDLLSKPSINGIELVGELTLADLDMYRKEDITQRIANSKSARVIDHVPTGTEIISSTLYYVGPDSEGAFDIYLANQYGVLTKIGRSTDVKNYKSGKGVKIDSVGKISVNIPAGKALYFDDKTNGLSNYSIKVAEATDTKTAVAINKDNKFYPITTGALVNFKKVATTPGKNGERGFPETGPTGIPTGFSAVGAGDWSFDEKETICYVPDNQVSDVYDSEGKIVQYGYNSLVSHRDYLPSGVVKYYVSRTTKNGENANAGWINWTLGVYPVGAIYQSTIDTDPSTYFPGTTWEKIKDVFLIGAGDKFKAGETGGETEVKLTVESIPAHSHKYTPYNLYTEFDGAHIHMYSAYPGAQDLNTKRGDTGDWHGMDDSGEAGTSWENIDHTHTGNKWPEFYTNYTTTSTTEIEAHNNMPKYTSIYTWKRTA